MPNSPIIASGQEFSVEVYSKVFNSGSTNVIIEIPYTSRPGDLARFRLYKYLNDKIQGQITDISNNGDNQVDIIGNEVDIDKWFYSALEKDSNVLSLFYNQNIYSENENINDNTLVNSLLNLNIGHTQHDQLLNGVIDEVRLSKIKRSNNWIMRSSMQNLANSKEEENINYIRN